MGRAVDASWATAIPPRLMQTSATSTVIKLPVIKLLFIRIAPQVWDCPDRPTRDFPRTLQGSIARRRAPGTSSRLGLGRKCSFCNSMGQRGLSAYNGIKGGSQPSSEGHTGPDLSGERDTDGGARTEEVSQSTSWNGQLLQTGDGFGGGAG